MVRQQKVVPTYMSQVSSNNLASLKSNGGALVLKTEPSQNVVNYLFGMAPILNAPTTTSASVLVTNNGDIASNGNLTVNTLVATNNCAGVPLSVNVANSCNVQFSASQLIPVALVKQFIYATANTRKVELCNFESTGVSSCSVIDVSGVTNNSTYGVVVSADGLYAYLMTGGDGDDSADGVYKCNINQSTKVFSGCVKQASTGTNNTRAGVFSSNGKFFYYNAMNVASIMRCNVDNNGNLSACVAVKSGLTSYVERLTMSFNGTNIFVNTGSGNLSCSVNNSTGEIISCVSSGGTANYYGLSFNLKNTKMYLIARNVMQYNYNPTTQLLSSGTIAYSGNTGYAIGFSANYAYIGYGRGILQCDIDNSTGTLSNCKDAPNTVLTALMEGITVFN